MIKVGLIGIGGMGRTHYGCYENIPDAQIVAICDVDERKLSGDWSSTALNIDTGGSSTVDLSHIKTYQDYQELIADPNVQLVDICLPTRLHAPVTVAALSAGKDVFCEKPMAFTVAECTEMERAVEASGRQLMIGHCLRYWPHYIEAQKIIAGGAHGRVLYARLQRTSGTPWWSWNNWLITGSQSGGAVLDMHIHDVDTALWWFGRPDSITADGIIVNDTPNAVDSIWRYKNGPVVYLHSIWDNNGGPFSFSFKVVMERATVVYDSASGNPNIQVIRHTDEGDSIDEIAASDESAYESEIRDYIACLSSGRKMERITPAASRVAVEVVREELRQIEEKNQ
ncbi:MAG TPA: Gfo/Idh/MocA family oxidoreductase [Abditibacteriaceae bacterium]|nr:Gfo/Idh/MocA family oxidoreductase [Abditibacteriaceae bacterium]